MAPRCFAETGLSRPGATQTDAYLTPTLEMDRIVRCRPDRVRHYPRPDGAGSIGALVRFEGVPSGGNSVMVYFSCEDCAVEGARVADAGGRVEREKMSVGQYGFILLANDTEGNMFGLHSP